MLLALSIASGIAIYALTSLDFGRDMAGVQNQGPPPSGPGLQGEHAWCIGSGWCPHCI